MDSLNMHGWSMGFGWIFIILVIALLVWLVLKNSSKTGLTQEQRSPIELLKERYAKGEIDKEEFEQKKKDILG
jgi:putative membrane protein